MKVLVVGFGNIGFRHTQSISANPLVNKLVVYDKFLDATAESRFSEIASQAVRRMVLKLAYDLSDIAKEKYFDFVVFATPATDRLKVVESIKHNSECGCCLLEKPVINSSKDLLALETLASNGRMYVNHHRRIQPGYLSLIRCLRDIKHIKITSSALGLLCNFSHHVDLVKMLCADGCVLNDASFHRIGLTPAKRPGFFEARGLINYFFSNGVQCFASTEVDSEDRVVVINTERGSFVINETAGLVTTPAGVETGFSMLLQSQMTGGYISQYAAKEELPLTKVRDVVHDYKIFLHSWERHVKNGRSLGISSKEDILFT